MPSSRDIIPSQNAGFEQQGSLDWVALSRASVSFSVDILSRLMAAGVQPFTIVVGQEVARSLPLSLAGQRNVTNALDKLRSYGSVGNVLWFGFGIRSLARTLGDTTEGQSLLALCAGLGECFDEEYSASVLQSLVRSYSPPAAFTPSLHEWYRLVKGCQGAFAATKFPILVNTFRRLMSPPTNLDIENLPAPSAENLGSIVKALGMLAQGHYESITVRGGLATSWVAAMAEWLYGLRVSIRMIANNQIIYETTITKGAQIQIEFLENSREPNLTSAGCLTLTSRTFLLNDVTEVFSSDNGPFSSGAEPRTSFYGGRLCWETCLSDVFGAAFSGLLDVPEFGVAFGCVASLLRTMYTHIPSPPYLADLATPSAVFADELEISGGYSYFDIYHKYEGLSGIGLIAHSIAWFPELQPIADASREQLSLPPEQARSRLKKALQKISEHSKLGRQIFFTIVDLCHLLSVIEPTDGMSPRQQMLTHLYHSKRVPHYYRHELMTIASYSNINRVLWMFTGGSDPGDATAQGGVSAFARSGVLCFFSILQSLDVQPQDLRRIKVVPGSIEYDGSSYNIITNNDLVSISPESENLHRQFSRACVAVTQRLDRLELSFNLFGPCNTDRPLVLNPGNVLDTRATFMRRAYCPNKPDVCQRQNIVIQARETAFESADVTVERALFALTESSDPSSEEAAFSNSEWVLIWQAAQLSHLEVAALLARNRPASIIVSEGQCLLCCFRALYREPREKQSRVSDEARLMILQI